MFLLSLILFANFAFSVYFLVLRAIELKHPLSSRQIKTQQSMKLVLFISVFIVLILYCIGTIMYLAKLDIFVQSTTLQILLILSNIVAVFVSIFLAFSLYFHIYQPEKCEKNALILLNVSNVLFVIIILWLGVESDSIDLNIIKHIRAIFNPNIIQQYANNPQQNEQNKQKDNINDNPPQNKQYDNPPQNNMNKQQKPYQFLTQRSRNKSIKPSDKGTILQVTKLDQTNMSMIVLYDINYVNTADNQAFLKQNVDINIDDEPYYIYIEYMPNGMGYIRHSIIKKNASFIHISRQINWDDNSIPKSLTKERAFIMYLFDEYGLDLSLMDGATRIIYEFTGQNCYNKFQIIGNNITKFGCVKFKYKE